MAVCELVCELLSNDWLDIFIFWIVFYGRAKRLAWIAARFLYSAWWISAERSNSTLFL